VRLFEKFFQNFIDLSCPVRYNINISIPIFIGLVMTDALTEILNKPELQEILHIALEIALRNDPILFYEKFIAPRAPKLSAVPSEVGFVEMTPAEEAAMMDELTTAIRDEHAKHKAEAITIS